MPWNPPPGLGAVSHGEAVAWGMARSCEMGVRLGVTPAERAREIVELLKDFGYETGAPHPLNIPSGTFLAAMTGDKKKKHGKLAFIVPAENGAAIVLEDEGGGENSEPLTPGFVERIIKGEYSL